MFRIGVVYFIFSLYLEARRRRAIPLLITYQYARWKAFQTYADMGILFLFGFALQSWPFCDLDTKWQPTSHLVATLRCRNPLATRVVATPRCLRGVVALRCQMQLQSNATMRCEPAL